MDLENLVAIASVGAFVVSLISLAFSARKYVAQREKDQNSERFQTYHGLIKVISSGNDSTGLMPLTSQIAFIYELRNYPEYAELSKTVLNTLREQWKTNEKPEKFERLQMAINDTLTSIN